MNIKSTIIIIIIILAIIFVAWYFYNSSTSQQLKQTSLQNNASDTTANISRVLNQTPDDASVGNELNSLNQTVQGF